MTDKQLFNLFLDTLEKYNEIKDKYDNCVSYVNNILNTFTLGEIFANSQILMKYKDKFSDSEKIKIENFYYGSISKMNTLIDSNKYDFKNEIKRIY